MKKWFNSLNFSQKLFYSLCPLVMVTLLTLSGMEYYYSSRILEEKAEEYLKNLASVTQSKIDDAVANVENAAFFINGDNTIQSVLKEESVVANDRQEFFFLYEKVQDKLETFALFCNEVDAVQILSDQGQIYKYVKAGYKKPINISEYMGEEDGRWLLDQGHILYMKRLYAYPSVDFLGYMALEVKKSGLYDVIADIDLSEGGEVFLVNEAGNIVVSKNGAQVGEQLNAAYRECFNGEEAFYESVSVEGVPYSVYISKPTSNNWHILLALPRMDYMRDISNLRNVVVALTAVIILFAVLAFFLVSKSTTRSIQTLARSMEDFGQGNFEVNCEIQSEDEIGRLGQAFNKMVKDMRDLVNNAYEQELMRQKAQMKSLQMQINPHFLYNTLDTINWMARIHQADEVGDMAAALGNMMRYSLAKNAVASIREEIKNLKDYLFIQNYRYGDKVAVSFEIEEGLMEVLIPKLLIQPVLENAIIHGIEEKLDAGHILISAWAEEEELYICVEDDGVGMTEEAIRQLLQEDKKPDAKGHTSIGIINVNKRIRLLYGPQYGLSVQSELGKGTKMTLHMKTEYPEQIK